MNWYSFCRFLPQHYLNNAACLSSSVNYLGLVRCCKAFLCIFQKQMDRNCRIINVTSMAGLIHGHQTGSAYMASKHAANAFSHVLRAECRHYCQVTTINPTFHGTGLVHNLKTVAESVWTNLDDEKKKQYGEGPSFASWIIAVHKELDSLTIFSQPTLKVFTSIVMKDPIGWLGTSKCLWSKWPYCYHARICSPKSMSESMLGLFLVQCWRSRCGSRNM
jgi:NAD(P)-dependent dehydrogenase (short-subunit alcohol dehydrogenase family)